MIYGSYFGGLFAVRLNPETGLALREGDLGHLVARRANPKKDNLEAPEVIYNQEFKKYYLFVSYDPLMTTYNVRVGRSDKPEGPYYDFFGNDLRETTNNYPVLTHPYRFANHAGWAGTGHCGVVEDGGKFFMLHQARLSPENGMMDLHVREIFWTADGWAVVSPQRYAGIEQQKLSAGDFAGQWEIITICDEAGDRELQAGQILGGQGRLLPNEVNVSEIYTFEKSGKISGKKSGKWTFNAGNQLVITFENEKQTTLIPHTGQDWENRRKTILFTGLTEKGFSLWGKKL
jgi:arabinan endo-1,5-alpha-L-arabinosidase